MIREVVSVGWAGSCRMLAGEQCQAAGAQNNQTVYVEEFRACDCADPQVGLASPPVSIHADPNRPRPIIIVPISGSGNQFVFNPELIFAAQKSGLSACGTAAFIPGDHWMFSAQITSLHGPIFGR